MRRIVMAILIVLTAICQFTLFQVFAIASIKPDLLLMLTVCFALMRGRRSGIWTGFFCGLAADLLYPGHPGFYALIYMWMGYLAGGAYRIFYDDDIKTPLMLVGGCSLLTGLYEYVFTYLPRGRIHILFYLRRIIIPQTIYTLLMTLLFYGLLYKLNRKMPQAPGRSIDSLV